MVKTAACPGFRVTGRLPPETENPFPVTESDLMVTATVPLAVTVRDLVTAVPTATLPKASELALRLNAEFEALSCNAKLREEESVLAVIVAVCAVPTAATSAVKDAVLAPAATTTLPGTVTAVLLLCTVTPTPPTAAAELSVTAQCVVPEPVKESVPHESAVTDGMDTVDVEALLTLIEVDFETVPCFAVNVTVCEVVTAETFAVKLALVEPEATVTEEGTEIALPLLERSTTTPFWGAAEDKVTVQLSVPAPVTEGTVQLRPESDAATGAEDAAPLPSSVTLVAAAEELPVMMFSWPLDEAVSLGAKWTLKLRLVPAARFTGRVP